MKQTKYLTHPPGGQPTLSVTAARLWNLVWSAPSLTLQQGLWQVGFPLKRVAGTDVLYLHAGLRRICSCASVTSAHVQGSEVICPLPSQHLSPVSDVSTTALRHEGLFTDMSLKILKQMQYTPDYDYPCHIKCIYWGPAAWPRG